MKHSRRLGWMLFSPALALWSGCSSGGDGDPIVATVVHGSGNVVDESRAVSGFTRVTYASEGAVHVEQGATESLRIRADDNLLAHLTTVVRSGRLELRTTGNVDLRPTQAIEWFLTVTSLEELDAGGIGSVTVSDLTTNRLALTCGGVGEVVLSSLSADELEVELGGIRGVRASGDVDRQTVTLPAVGFQGYDAEDLRSREARIHVHGQADATVRVSDLLVATITSSGSVYYYGSPTVQATISGTGQVEQLGADVELAPVVVGTPSLVMRVIWANAWEGDPVALRAPAATE